MADDCPVSVIVPAISDATSWPALASRISEVLKAARLGGEILVVGAPDGAGQTIAPDRAVVPSLRQIASSSQGHLSSAVVTGMREAQGDVLVVIGDDLEHPPEKIPELVRALQSEQVDFAIGSRQERGPHPGWRWFGAKLARLVTRPLTPARDPMAGFFAIRRSTFEEAAPLDPVGRWLGLELLVKCGCRRIEEIPIDGEKSRAGTSQASPRESWNDLRHLKRLYEYKLGAMAQLVQFASIGTTGMCVDLAGFAIFLHWVPVYLARALAIWIAMTWNFWLNRRLTFSHTRERCAFRQYLLFCLSCALGALLSWLVFLGLHASFPLFARLPVVAAMAGIVVGTISNFLMSRHVAFR